jgi:hypothetical protein
VKTSFAATLAILAAAGFLGWRNQVELSAMKREHLRLIAASGPDPVSMRENNRQDLSSRPSRLAGSREGEGRELARRFAAFDAASRQTLPDRPWSADLKRRMEGTSLNDEMLHLDLAGLKGFLEELNGIPAMKNSSSYNGALSMMAEDYPGAMLDWFASSSGPPVSTPHAGNYAAEALARLSETDPKGAEDWLRKGAAEHAGLNTQVAQRAIVGGAARTDPALAFSLIGDLGLTGSAQLVGMISYCADTGEKRTATVLALRNYLEAVSDPDTRESMLQSGIGGLAAGETLDGVEKAAQWVASTGLNQEEIAAFAKAACEQQCTSQWLEWAAGKIPPETLAQVAGQMVTQWTNEDRQAAEQWVSSQPDGPVKDAAIGAYATATSDDDPAVAARWVVTMQPSPKRDEVEGRILSLLRARDPEAAAKFAQENGLE